jgi:2-polyprenyl-6-methoxyphenol hydroxylase-like FAD-dependent oxidoreductase
MTGAQIRIGIVGSGIGGLTLALALRQRGWPLMFMNKPPSCEKLARPWV